MYLTFRPIRRRALTAVAATMTVAALGAAADAQAVGVTTGADGLQIREPNTNRLVRVNLSLVQDGGATKYRVEVPEFGGEGIVGAGSGCTLTEPQNGLDVAVCDRVNPKVDVSMGALGDTFAVDPSFPDPIDIFGGLGNDGIRLGAGNDRARGGSGGDSIRGEGGNDDIAGDSGNDGISGGPGNDTLVASGGLDSVFGGDGDDVLSTDGERFTNATLTGGPGKDVFDAKGGAIKIDSRDGIAESVSCGRRPREFFRRLPSRAVIDLVDTPSDSALLKGGCTSVDRAPNGEKTAIQLRSKSLRLRRGVIALKLRCTTSKRCKGKVKLSSKRVKRSARYSVAGRRTKTIRFRAAKRSAGKTATVALTEKGALGGRSERTSLRLKR